MNAATLRTVIAGLLVLLAAMARVFGAEDSLARRNVDVDFMAGLAEVKQATGLIEGYPGQTSIDWAPHLQMIVGIKAVEGAKRTVRFVELTTLQPPPTNAAGQAWRPRLRTNHWAWSPTNKVQFVSSNYPVRVRVFDEAGRMLKGGQTRMAWVTMTEGLLDLCRLSLDSPTNRGGTLSAGRKPSGKKTDSSKPPPDERLMRATGGGFLWMFDMFRALQTVPTVAEVWAKAQCAIRWPSPWTLIKAPVRGIPVELRPRTEQVTLADPSAATGADLNYLLPVDLLCDQRQLSHVEIRVGPARGAEILLGGIRTIRARHPTKPKYEFVTQVLAAGRAREP